MANYNIHFLLLATFILISLTSQSHQQSLEIPAIISAAPALLPDPPNTEILSPDITPLLPSPGGPARPSMPTIPSSRSPPNPDSTTTVWPDSVSAFAPTGPVQESSAVSRVLGKGSLIKVEAFFGFLAHCLFMMFFMI
ncbi:hypothetical protein PHJA_000332700 [Phtheirospermum japonicum]|uniref:Uncharacterized protein n=1 Tax=Phtheirospermum japonicum TaxID=374723 RepID=A0A830BAS4_9LAMI|nr:hypothetical protein PHJA_000332700 [Phtheirospermum japonicum]